MKNKSYFPMNPLLEIAALCKRGEDNPASKILFIPREDGLTVFVSNGKEARISFVKAEDSGKGLHDIQLFCINGYVFSSIARSQKESRITASPELSRLCIVWGDGLPEKATVFQDEQPRGELTLLPCDRHLIQGFEHHTLSVPEHIDREITNQLLLALAQLKIEAPVLDEALVQTLDSELLISYRTGDHIGELRLPRGSLPETDLHLSKASFKAILEHMQKGDILALKQDQSDIYLVLEEETRCLRQNRQDLKIEPGDTSDEGTGFSFNVERFRFAWRLRDLKQHKEQMCGRLAYLYLTQSDGLFIFGEVPHLQSRDHVKVDGRKLPREGALCFEVDDLGDIRFGLNKYGADKSTIGISILDKDDGSCTLQIFDAAGKAQRLVLISINCRWDDDAFRRFESAVSEWNQKEKDEPLLSALEQQLLF